MAADRRQRLLVVDDDRLARPRFHLRKRDHP